MGSARTVKWAFVFGCFTIMGCGVETAVQLPAKTETPQQTAAPRGSEATAASAPDQPATARPDPKDAVPLAEALTNKPIKPIPVPRPATAAEVLKQLDLRTFPKLNSERQLDERPTYVYYSAKSSVAGADAFHQAEMRSRKWKMISPDTSTTDQYSDRLYERDGFYVRVSIGAGSDEGIVGIGLSSLGNYDMHALPRPDDAQVNEASTPVNVSYSTRKSIPQIATFCRESLAQLGWREYTTIEATDIDVPHYKSLTFYQNGLRMMVSIARQPQNVTEPPIVAYFLESALPFDVPLAQDSQEVKLDWYFGRAQFQSKQPVTAIVDQLRQQGQRLGWKEHTDDFVSSEKSATLFVEDEPDFGFGISVYEHEGATKVAFERITFKKSDDPKSETPDDATVAEAEPESNALSTAEATTDEPMPDDSIDKALAEAMNKAQSDVNRELDNLSNELKKNGINLDVNKAFGGLVQDAEDAADLAEALSDDDDDDDDDDHSDETDSNASDSASGPVRLAEVHLGSGKGFIDHEGVKHPLQHAMAFQQTESGEPVTVIYLSDKPLRVAKAKGADLEELSISDVRDPNSDTSLELRVKDGYTQANCSLKGGSLSFGNSDVEVKTTVEKGRLKGSIGLPEPVEFFDEKIQFQVTLDVQLSTLTTGAVEKAPVELVADAQYEYPIPEGCSSVSREGTRYQTEINATIEAPLADVLKFYRTSMVAGGWKEDAAGSSASATGAKLRFSGGKGPVNVTLSPAGSDTQIVVSLRDDARAKQDGMVPPAGKAFIILGNATEKELVFVVAGKQYRLKADEGAVDPSKAVRIEVAPGKHSVSIQKNGATPQTEELNVTAGTAWGAIATPEGEIFSTRVY